MKILIIYIGLVAALLLSGCTVINRDYKVTIYVCEGSSVDFKTEILADIDKEAETQTDADVNAEVDVPIIP